MERKDFNAIDTVFLFVAEFTRKNHGFVEKCDLTCMNVLYTEMVERELFDQRGGMWVEGELVGLRLEIWKFETVVEYTFAPHCSSGLLTLKFYLHDHLVDDMKRFRSLSFVDAGPVELFNVLIRKFIG